MLSCNSICVSFESKDLRAILDGFWVRLFIVACGNKILHLYTKHQDDPPVYGEDWISITPFGMSIFWVLLLIYGN